MICPNCGSNLSDKKKRCDRCGTDLTIYKKVFRASNLFYNTGLAKAKVRDLSGSVVALRKSLDLNKLNTNARNLLGLVYYEMGETVAALSEWVISKHFQPDHNDADEYIQKVQSNLTRLDSLNQAIKRYNTALGMAKQGSDDLAIIQLKKVVSLNTNFLRAYQLLALLLIKTGEKDKAKKYLLKASKIDVSNTTTLRYLQELEIPVAKDLEANPEAEPNKVGAIMPISSYKEDKPNIMAFVNLVVGVVIGLAVMAFLVVPTIKKNQTTDNGSGTDDTGYSLAQIQEMNNTITTLKNDKSDLQKQISDLKNQMDQNATDNATSNIDQPLFDAANSYLTELAKPAGSRNLTGVSDLLIDIDANQFSSEAAKNLYSLMKSATFPSAITAHYEKGHGNYSNGKYQDAITELQLCLKYDPTNVDAIYFIARSYHRMNDAQNAITYYNRVIKEFPDSSRVSDATGFLNQLQSQTQATTSDQVQVVQEQDGQAQVNQDQTEKTSQNQSSDQIPTN